MSAMNRRVASTVTAMLAMAFVLPVAAQTDEQQAEVNVRGQSVVEVPAQGLPKDLMAQISRRVSIAGLDLSKSSDAAELHNRIDETAQLVCRRLGELYPEASPAREANEEASCVRDAVGDAMEQVKYRVAGAQRRHIG